MSDTTNIAIDPYIICLPDPCYSSEDIESFISRLLAWSEALRRQNLEVLVSESCCQALLEDGLYPYEHRLRDLLQKFSVDFVDHNTVCVTVRNLIERTDRLEDAIGIRYVLHDSQPDQIEPDVSIVRLPQKTGESFVDMLFALAAHRKSDVEKRYGDSLASSISDPMELSDYELHIEGIIDEIDWMDTNCKNSIQLPCSVDEVFILFDGYDAFRNHIGKWELWDGAKEEQGVRDAIESSIEELIEARIDANYREEYVIGSGFLDSLQAWGFGSIQDYAMLLVESCSRIVLGQPKNEIKAFWTNKKTKRQRKRDDGALAYRTHLTKKSAGYRLMFWKRRDNTIEFANVGDKDELKIL